MNGFELPRRNRALAHEERWQPPPFVPATTPRERLQAAARRLLDLQAASIWNDLRCLLEGVEGDVVDVGAGAQPYRRLLSGRVHYRAIDVGLAGAFGYQQPDTDYFEGSHWPLEDASVDLVLSTEVLEHVLDPAAFLAEARRVLRPGARLLLTVPFAARWHYIPHDYWRYTPSSLSNLLATAGFGEVCVYARGNELTVACAKVIGLVLPALLPARRNALSQFARLGAIVCAPLVFIVAAIGQLSLRGQGGDDCLGYTVTARVSPQEIAAAG